MRHVSFLAVFGRRDVALGCARAQVEVLLSHGSHSPCSFASSLRALISKLPALTTSLVLRRSIARNCVTIRSSSVGRCGALVFFALVISKAFVRTPLRRA